MFCTYQGWHHSNHLSPKSCFAEITQFRKGLSTLGVADTLTNYSSLLYTFYCKEHGEDLTAGWILCIYLWARNLFIRYYSEIISSNQIFRKWKQFQSQRRGCIHVSYWILGRLWERLDAVVMTFVYIDHHAGADAVQGSDADAVQGSDADAGSPWKW